MKKRIKLVYAVGILMLLFSGAGTVGVWGQQSRIVSIDTAKLLQAHPAFSEAQAQLEAEVREYQQRLDGMSEEEQMMAQHHLQQRSIELQQQALDALREDIRQIARQQGYDYVIDSNALIVGGQDVTEEMLNKIKSSSFKY